MALAFPSVIHQAARDWSNAAKNDRADVFLLGDSIAQSLDGGLTNAIQNNYGVAGSGITASIGASGYTTAGLASFEMSYPFPNGSMGLSENISDVPSARQGYVLTFGAPVTAAATPGNFLSFFLQPNTYLPESAAYDWHLYTTTPVGLSGSMTATRLMQQAPNTIYQVVGPLSTATPVGNNLQHSVFSFNAIPSAAGVYSGAHLTDITNTSILYSRILRPNVKGATITSWGYGSKSTLDMITDKLNPMTAQGRATFLNAMVDGGSGKLMVMIEEGNNDHAFSTPSIRGVAPTNTAAGFNDNLTYLMDIIRQAWVLTGRTSNDLSFLLIGLYEKNPIADPDGSAFIRGSAQVMRDVANANADTSFVDIYSFAPNWLAASNAGYMADDIHPTMVGANFYANGIVAQLLPEPTSLSAIALISIALLRRKNRIRHQRSIS